MIVIVLIEPVLSTVQVAIAWSVLFIGADTSTVRNFGVVPKN